MLQESFDPIRIRLRVIPIAKAPVGKGKNADFYFVEAGKKSLRGELPQAFDLLRRGLAISPNHFLCRFSHGVLQFKFGLIVEASQDFKQLTLTNPKEPLPYFNLAICLVQMGVPNRERPV
jgi:tetratricopeptide (TPR) repeat protein